MADAPADTYILEREGRRGLPWRRAWRIPRNQTLQAEQNTVIHEGPCLNLAEPLPQKPRRLAQQRDAPWAFRTTRHLLIVEASARASAAKSRGDRSNMQWPAISANRIEGARKDSHRRAAEMADAPPDDAHVLQREGRRQGLP